MSTSKRRALNTSAFVCRTFATSALTAVAVLAANSASAQAVLPVGGTVTSGDASIRTAESTVAVTQTSTRAIVSWNSFDVGAGNKVVFLQPDANSATLNRVTGTTGSTIAGQISANGAVYLVNPNGIAITSTGAVQTGGGFVASTLDIADGDFNAGRLAFAGTGASKGVSNAGTITAGAGGYVALLGGTVSNAGTISVPLGKVALGSGERLALDLNGDGFLQVALPSDVAGTLVASSGSISASGGRIELKAATARDAVRSVINMSGSLSADSATGNAGSIVLLGGDGGTVRVGGTLSARATGTVGNGGFVETSGKTVDFTGIKVDTRATAGKTGTWLVDPDDLIVDAAAAANIVTALGSSNVTLQTTGTTAATSPGGLVTPTPGGAGDITINSAITWGSANTLSLLAYNNIALNAAITGTAGGLTLTAGNGTAFTGAISATGAVNVGTFNLTNGNWTQNAAGLPAFSATDFRVNTANATFLRVIGGDGSTGTPYQISDLYGLQGIGSGGLAALNYVLANNIDASATAAWNAGVGFNPIGELSVSGQSGFTGSFNGQNHIITGLTINDPTRALYFGLFGLAANATISNIGLVGVNITARDAGGIGALAGDASGGSITNAYSTGTVSVSTGSTGGGGHVGGLVGNLSGSLSNSYSTATVSGLSYVGGLVGGSGNTNAVMTNVYATGAVSGTQFVGGLIGSDSATLSNAFATGNVTATQNYVGGLTGSYSNGTMTSAYATGTVSSPSTFVGGLVGRLSSGTITSVYATGAASGSASVGGLVGYQSGTSTINGAYASGMATGAAATTGGLVGQKLSGTTLANAYWDTFSTNQAAGVGASAGTVTNINPVTSDPNAGGGPTAFIAASYANLPTASGIGSTTPAGFVFLAGNSTRPFLAFEVPTASVAGVDTGGRVLVNSAHALQLLDYYGVNGAGTYSALGGSYGLAGNLNLAETGANTGTAATSAGMWSAAGFVPIGTDGANGVFNGSGYVSIATIAANGTHGFAGSLNGNGYTLSNLTISRSTIDNVGLFGVTSGAIGNVTVGGTVRGFNGAGGLVGLLFGSVTAATSTANVTGNNLVGGLVGNATDGSSITRSGASGTVSGVADVGGLAGYTSGATISRSFATGTASGYNYVAGLIGYQYNGTTSDSYATGAVAATAVKAIAGGLVGTLYGGSVIRSYAANQVTSPGTRGGLIGKTVGTTSVTNSYWDTTLSGIATSAGGTGRTTAQMTDPVNYAANYPGWDFTAIWLPPSAGNYPKLR